MPGRRAVVPAVLAFAGSAAVTLLLWAFIPLLWGWQPYVVTSESMSPLVTRGDVVLVAPGTGARPGDVITFDRPGTGTVTHRVVAGDPTTGYLTKGDANSRPDTQPVPATAVLGRARLVVPLAGQTGLLFKDHPGVPVAAVGLALLAGLHRVAGRRAVPANHRWVALDLAHPGTFRRAVDAAVRRLRRSDLVVPADGPGEADGVGPTGDARPADGANHADQIVPAGFGVGGGDRTGDGAGPVSDDPGAGGGRLPVDGRVGAVTRRQLANRNRKRKRKRKAPTHRAAARRGAGVAAAAVLAVGGIVVGSAGTAVPTRAAFTGTTNTDIGVATRSRFYPVAVLAAGPIGYWRLNETSGTTRADSVAGNTLTCAAGVTAGVSGAVAKDATGASRITANTGRCAAAAGVAAHDLTGPFTVLVWHRLTAWPATSFGRIVAKYGGAVNTVNYMIAWDQNGTSVRAIIDTTNARYTAIKAMTATTTWHQYAMTWDGTNLRLNIDGVPADGLAAPGTPRTTTTALTLGYIDSQSAVGDVDELALYNRALSQAELADLYSLGAS